LAESPGENEGEEDVQKYLHSRTWKGETKRMTQKRMDRRSRKRSSSAGEWEVEESWWQIGQNGGTLFDRPKLATGCRANGRRKRKRRRRRL